MDKPSLVLDLTRVGDALKVVLDEKDGRGERTLRPYEIHAVAWEQVDKECRIVLSLLGRASRNADQSPECVANLKRSGELLFDLLFPPKVKGKIARTNSQILTLRLDDSLLYIPWQLLYDGREFLCRRFAMGRIVSTRQAPTAQSDRELNPPYKILIVADPRGDLEAAYREGLAVRNYLDEQRQIFRVDFKSFPVDVGFVKKSLREYDIVHYAGHAIYRPENSIESGWLLHDGTLTAGEVAAMGGVRPMPALVFANACQSGRSSERHAHVEYGEQVYGLANAFLLAGVRHYVGTYGDLMDESGGVVAKRFYRALGEGNDVGIALKEARLAVIDRFGEGQLAWASYMLYGAPHFEFASNGKVLPEGRARYPGAEQPSYAVRGGGTNKLSEKAPPRPLSWITSFFALLTAGFLGYSFSSWQGGKNFVASQSIVPAPSAMNVSPVSNSASQVPLSLSVHVIGQRKEPDGSYTEIFVREGSVLRSGDQFQVYIRSDRDAYVYALLYNSLGQAWQLFPDPKIEQPGFITAHQGLVIPDKHLWFWLDDQPGMETIYALALERPLSNMPELLAKMESVQAGKNQPGLVPLQESVTGRQRGVGGIAQAGAENLTARDGELIKRVTDIIVATGAVVRSMSFHHR